MSTPCVVTSSRSEPCCGRASATAAAASASAASTSGAWRSLHAQRRAGPRSSAGRAGERDGARASGPARAATRRASTSGATSAAHSHSGSWKRKPPQSITPPCLPPRPATGGLSFASSAGTSARTAARCRSASGREPLAPRELDAVGRLGQVAHDRQQLAAVRVAAQERERLRRRHLEDRRAEPALEVALRDRGEPDVEGPQLAARRAGPRPPARRARAAPRRRAPAPARRRLAARSRGGAGAERARARAPPSSRASEAERDPEGRADRDRRRAADVGELLLGRVLRQQRDDLQRERRRGRLAVVPSASR